MTDARLPSRWLLDPTYNALSDGAWRTFTRLLMWSVDARTDGVIQLDQLDLIPRARAEHIPELTAAGVVDVRAGVLTLTCFTSTQTSREQLEAAEAAREAERAADRERKRRDRLHKKGDHSLCDHGDDPAESQSGRKSGRKSDRNPAPETEEGRKAGRQALTDPPTDRRNDADDRPPRVTLPGSVLGPQAADEPSNDLDFAAGRVDLESSWPPTLCTTTGHHGCGWQTRPDCPDCPDCRSKRRMTRHRPNPHQQVPGQLPLPLPDPPN